MVKYSMFEIQELKELADQYDNEELWGLDNGIEEARELLWEEEREALAKYLREANIKPVIEAVNEAADLDQRNNMQNEHVHDALHILRDLKYMCDWVEFDSVHKYAAQPSNYELSDAIQSLLDNELANYII